MARSPPHSHKGGSGSLSPPLARRGSAPLAASSRVRARRACAFRCTSQQPHAADGLVRTRARVTGEAASPSARAALVRRRQGPSPESARSLGVWAAGRPLGPPRCLTALRSARCPGLLGLPPWRGASRCAIGGVALKPRCRRACQSRAGHVPRPGVLRQHVPGHSCCGHRSVSLWTEGSSHLLSHGLPKLPLNPDSPAP